jgi:AraC family transcriptional regulator
VKSAAKGWINGQLNRTGRRRRERNIKMTNVIVSRRSKFDPLLRSRPSTTLVSSRDLNWSNLLVEQLHVRAQKELPEAISDRYILALWRSNGFGEHANDRGRFFRYSKPAGSLTIVTPGIVPAVNPSNDCTWLLCTFEPGFLHAIEDEMGPKYAARPRYRTGLRDDALRRLLQLLFAELQQGGAFGQLYADHLALAAATRLFSLDAAKKDLQQGCSLPGFLLRRVLDRMHNLTTSVDLQTLAAESGYSPRHFLRMFQASTGMTPHRYLLQLRIERARELMRDKTMSLIDIAAECGFSSHSHMSSAFHQFMGVTPTSFRRNL